VPRAACRVAFQPPEVRLLQQLLTRSSRLSRLAALGPRGAELGGRGDGTAGRGQRAVGGGRGSGGRGGGGRGRAEEAEVGSEAAAGEAGGTLEIKSVDGFQVKRRHLLLGVTWVLPGCYLGVTCYLVQRS
jgi:hypothetical protein